MKYFKTMLIAWFSFCLFSLAIKLSMHISRAKPTALPNTCMTSCGRLGDCTAEHLPHIMWPAGRLHCRTLAWHHVAGWATALPNTCLTSCGCLGDCTAKHLPDILWPAGRLHCRTLAWHRVAAWATTLPNTCLTSCGRLCANLNTVVPPFDETRVVRSG